MEYCIISKVHTGGGGGKAMNGIIPNAQYTHTHTQSKEQNKTLMTNVALWLPARSMVVNTRLYITAK